MFGDEIDPQFFVRSPDIIRKSQTQVPLKTDVARDLEKRPFVPWLAVYNDAVHVENYRLLFVHRFGSDDRSALFEKRSSQRFVFASSSPPRKSSCVSDVTTSRV